MTNTCANFKDTLDILISQFEGSALFSPKWISHFILILFSVFTLNVKSIYAINSCSIYLNTKMTQKNNSSEMAVLTLDQHRQLHYHSYNLKNLDQPTFVFFPGIYSALAHDSDFFKHLEDLGVPYVSFNFSSHPRSIATLDPKKDLPNFKDLSTKDLANEALALVQHLGLTRPVAVTTSYSSSLIEHLHVDVFPVVLDTAPIGRLSEDYESQSYIMDMISIASSFNPMANWFTLRMKEQHVYRFWNDHVNLIKHEIKPLQYPILNKLATEAYIAMIKAVNSYDIRDLNFTKGPERIFILASEENKRRLDLQLQGVRKVESQLGHMPQVYTVEGADHIIAYSQPEAYINVLLDILKDL